MLMHWHRLLKDSSATSLDVLKAGQGPGQPDVVGVCGKDLEQDSV